MAAANPPAAAGSVGGGAPSNHKWLVIIGLTPLAVVIIAAIVYLVGPSEPSVALTPPPGYQAITDAYWAYAIPTGWSQDSAYTDSNGDFLYRGAGGWVGETLRIRASPSTLGEQPPLTLASFGQVRSTPYQLANGRPTTVPGATVAWSYDFLRGGVVSSVVNAWIQGSRTEIWLLAHGTPTQNSTIVTSLRS
jgi:hypothetical protein